MGQEFPNKPNITPDSLKLFGQRVDLEGALASHTAGKVSALKASLKETPPFVFLSELVELDAKLDEIALSDPKLQSTEALEIVERQEQIISENKPAWDDFQRRARQIIESEHSERAKQN